jgi:uncharacterized membrane protein YbhN (UPF0104 family)
MSSSPVPEPLRKRRWWPLAKRVFTIGFFLAVTALLITQARLIKWDDVGTALGAFQLSTLLLAAALTVASHTLFSSFDLLGRIYAGHHLARSRVFLIAWICYAFTLNLGSVVGGIGFRFRLYSRFGLDNATIARVYAMAVSSNWLGYLFVGGTVFTLRPLALPANWHLGSHTLQFVGAVLLLLGVAYVALCAWSPRRSWTLRGNELTLPSFRLAALQAAVSAANWLLIASVIYVAFQHRVDFTIILSILLASAIAGVLTHVPAGLGVLEAVFIALLGHRMPTSQILAALLAYRAIYYLCPLVLATALYALTEAKAKAQGRVAAGPALAPADR